MASRLYEIWRKDVFSDIETGPRALLLSNIFLINAPLHHRLQIRWSVLLNSYSHWTIFSLMTNISHRFEALIWAPAWVLPMHVCSWVTLRMIFFSNIVGLFQWFINGTLMIALDILLCLCRIWNVLSIVLMTLIPPSSLLGTFPMTVWSA